MGNIGVLNNLISVNGCYGFVFGEFWKSVCPFFDKPDESGNYSKSIRL